MIGLEASYRAILISDSGGPFMEWDHLWRDSYWPSSLMTYSENVMMFFFQFLAMYKALS